MKTLFRACAVCLFWFGFAHAAVEGDPFSDGKAFSDLHAIEASDTFLLGGFAESRNQFSLNDPETPISLRQKVQVEALWRRDVLSLFGSLEGQLRRGRPHVAGRPFPVESRSPGIVSDL